MNLDFFEHHEEKMRSDQNYRSAYEALEPEFTTAKAMIKARSAAGMTQMDVASKMGVSQPVVARMESGRNISFKSLQRYASAVGQPITLVIQP